MAASSAGAPSNTTRCLSTITWSRSSATAPSSCDTSSTAAWWSLHQVHERVAEQLLRLDVDAGDRFVEHEQLGIRGERVRDQRALLLPARELVQPLAPVVGERDRLDRVVDRLAVGARAALPPPLLGQPPGRHHLVDGGREVGRDARPLRHVPHPPAVAEVGRRDAEHLDRSRLRREQAEQDPQQRRLPRAVRARRARRTPRRAPRAPRGRAPPRRRRRTTRRSAASTTGADSELSMILIMAARCRPAHQGRREWRRCRHDHGHGTATTTATPCGAPRPATWAGCGWRWPSPSPSWWWRRSPRSSPARSRCCPTPPTCSPTAWPSPSRSARSWSPTGRRRRAAAPSGCSGSRSSRRC